jgi:cobalt/nickel transport system ATP-binding protein
MHDYIIQTEDLGYSYPDGTKALQGINLKIKRGSKVAVLGSNGSGKSTLFLNLNGVLKPNKGKVILNNKEVSYNSKALRELRRTVGIVFQDPDIQLFSANVYQEVSFGAMNLNLPKAEVKRRVDKALIDTDTLVLKDKATHFLSYGQKKRVSIADILVMEPDLIILDEPTSSLDPRHADESMALINDICHTGTTVIISTHDIDLAFSWANYIIVMKDGSIIGEGTPLEIFRNAPLLKAGYIAKPVVLEVYDRLVKNEIIKNGGVPYDKNSLFNLISNI